MNTDRGAFVALPGKPSRVGVVTFGNGLTRTVIWLDDTQFPYLHQEKQKHKGDYFP